MKSAFLGVLLLTLAAPAGRAGGPPTSPDPTARFWEARRILLAGDVATAAELFRTLVKENPKADVADDCLYWIGRCRLRQKDREPDAVVAFLRLVKEYPESPFVDDAARELARLKDRTVIPLLKKRLAGGGTAAELAARGLAEFGQAEGIDYLAKHAGPGGTNDLPERAKKGAAARSKETGGGSKGAGGDKAEKANGTTKDGARPEVRGPSPEALRAEIEELRREVAELRREVEESLAIVRKLVDRENAGGGAADGSKR